MHLANNIIESIRKENIPHEKSTVADHLTLSIGVATLIPNKETPSNSLVDKADILLYKAKNAGRNRIYTV